MRTPGVQPYAASDPRITRGIEESRRGRIAEPPEERPVEALASRQESLERRGDIRIQLLEAKERAVAVSAAPMIEAEGRNPSGRISAGQEEELAMTADAILRTA